jgi:PAS domain-containing protein
MVVIASDVTPQVKKRQKLEESDQKIRSIVQNAPFPIALCKGREMQKEYANDALKKVWRKGNDLIGKCFKDVMPEMKDQQINEQLDGVFASGMAYNGKNKEIEVAIQGKLKTFYYNYNYTAIFNSDCSVYGIMNTSTNVTDLNLAKKKAEEVDRRFRNTLKQAPIGVTIFCGENYMVAMAHDAYLLLIDKTEEEIKIVGWLDIFYPDDREENIKKMIIFYFYRNRIFCLTPI